MVFFFTPLLALTVGVRPAEFENRKLAAAPALADGWDLFTGLPRWAADQLPFRDAAVRSSDQISRGVFGEPAPLSGTPVDSALPTSVIGPVASPPATELPPVAGFPKVIEGADGWLYFGYDVEGKCVPIRPPDQIITAVQRLRAAVEASGRRFVLVIAPDKSTMVPEHLPDSFAGQQCARAYGEQFWHRVTTEGGALDLRSGIRDVAKTGVPVYNQFDTHWTDAGSLVMVRAVAEEIQPGISRTWQVKPGQVREYQADLPRLIGREGTDRIRMYSLAPDGRQDRTQAYADYMHVPVRFASAPTRGMVQLPVAMITDSFSLPASRYLAAAFSDLTAVFYATAGKDLDTVTEVMAGGQVVVLEVVERNLAGGLLPLLDDAVIAHIAQALSARPVR
jgi:hypothetical protein